MDLLQGELVPEAVSKNQHHNEGAGYRDEQ